MFYKDNAYTYSNRTLVLGKFQFFNVLSNEDREQLGQVAPMQSICKDQMIYFTGDVSNSFYLVKEGKVKITQMSETTGKEFMLALV